jgi:hypothetical protein
MDLRTQEAASEELLIGLRAIGGVGPEVAGGVVPIDQLGQQDPVVAGCMSDRPAADQAMPAVDPDMVLAAEGWAREIDARGAVHARLGLCRPPLQFCDNRSLQLTQGPYAKNMLWVFTPTELLQ